MNHYLYFTPYQNIQFHYDNLNENSPHKEILRDIENKFLSQSAQGLLYLAQIDINFEEDISVLFWKDFINHYLFSLCSMENLAVSHINLEIDESYIEEKYQDAPPMHGNEYLTQESLKIIWLKLNHEIMMTLVEKKINLQQYLDLYFPKLKMVGKVYFHLAENKNDLENPFAFLATYSTKLSEKLKPKHLPLGKAIEEFSQQKSKKNILNILEPIQNATKESLFLNDLLESGEIFHPQMWVPKEALFFLKDVSIYEKNGIIVRIPNWWDQKKPLKPQVKISIGDNKPKHISLETLLEFDISLSLQDIELTKQEIEEIFNSSSPLIKLRGNWVEVDKEKLNEVLSHWKKVQKKVGSEGISFLEGMRLLSGTSSLDDESNAFDRKLDMQEWSQVTAGSWFCELLNQLRRANSNKIKTPDISKKLNADLRVYQKHGVEWLWLIYSTKLGAALCDDMGLGKTIQVISLLLCIQSENSSKNIPSLLVVPTSLLANWKAELTKFAPSIRFKILHSSQISPSEMAKINKSSFHKECDLVIVTYGGIIKLEELLEIKWNVVILDEAQAIKNANTKQALICKKLTANSRIALTGTPVENKLSDLWSIFDFICPGLLGNAKTFYNYSKRLNEESKKLQHNVYKPLRELVRPYILRRLKTDKNVISDLPDKTEMKTYCPLSKKQIMLYQKTVLEMDKLIKNSEGIKRQGIIFSYLSQFKQICNHPDHWNGSGDYLEQDSGKFQRLREILELINEKQEKVLIFTQFKEIIEYVENFSQNIFGRKGLTLHGGTNAKKRQEYVDLFNSENGPPFFILSIKAGGTGLNLVSATHVIHFDRWWNPAVENQATDRAFRIGQKKNVIVHKFICQGTIEEKIDNMIEEKKNLSNEILEGGESLKPLTELSNEELIKLVSLDISKFDI